MDDNETLGTGSNLPKVILPVVCISPCLPLNPYCFYFNMPFLVSDLSKCKLYGGNIRIDF